MMMIHIMAVVLSKLCNSTRRYERLSHHFITEFNDVCEGSIINSRALNRSMSFGRPPTFSSFQVTAPDRGSFPLDHEGECKDMMSRYLSCLQNSANNSSQCRGESKKYLECRMTRGLMQQEEWKNLGMSNVKDPQGTSESADSCTTCARTPNQPGRNETK